MITFFKINSKLAFVLFLITISSSFYSQNLLKNGDFEIGGSGIGFIVNGLGYTQISSPFTGITATGNYAITTNPAPMNTAFFISSGDHTTGTGRMMVIDGNTNGGSRFWRAGNSGGGICGLTVGATYTFSYWLKSVSTKVTNTATQANIGVYFVNVSNVSPSVTNTLAPLPASGWQKAVYTFVAAGPCVNIELWNNNTNAVGNDFAVDDFSLMAPVLPLTLNYNSSNPTCPNITDGTISVYGVGGVLPYLNYNLTGAQNQTNATGVFKGLAPGTYFVSVTDAVGTVSAQTEIILKAPKDITINSPTTLCLGESTSLTASGSDEGYVWTASPLDASLINSNNSTITVSPSQTTTYTVVSGSNSSPINQVYNGDFSLGNVGFSTDYKFIANAGTNGVQKAYGIVPIAYQWFQFFPDCTDHTTANGNMMVVDGSTSNAGNDKVWGQTITVLPNQNYRFSYWLQTIATPSPAIIEVMINGASVGIATAPVTNCGWVEYSYVWNSGTATSAVISLYDRVIISGGNDFSLDDISFKIVSCNLSKSVVVTVNQPVIPVFSPISPICFGSSNVELPLISNNGITGTWLPALNNADTTLYTFTPSVGQCSKSSTTTITVNPLPEFSIADGCEGTDYILKIIQNEIANSTYSWYNSIHQLIGTTSSVIISDEGSYSCQVVNNGCIAEKTIAVSNSFCRIPKGISPNGDGSNDFFDLSHLNVKYLQIYNRYGLEVYSKNDYKNEWSGKSNEGKELPDGTYYYVVHFESGKEETGWVYINK